MFPRSYTRCSMRVVWSFGLIASVLSLGFWLHCLAPDYHHRSAAESCARLLYVTCAGVKDPASALPAFTDGQNKSEPTSTRHTESHPRIGVPHALAMCAPLRWRATTSTTGTPMKRYCNQDEESDERGQDLLNSR
jgi:hypothetical protein